jgi:hypothetical protein
MDNNYGSSWGQETNSWGSSYSNSEESTSDTSYSGSVSSSTNTWEESTPAEASPSETAVGGVGTGSDKQESENEQFDYKTESTTTVEEDINADDSDAEEDEVDSDAEEEQETASDAPKAPAKGKKSGTKKRRAAGASTARTYTQAQFEKGIEVALKLSEVKESKFFPAVRSFFGIMPATKDAKVAATIAESDADVSIIKDVIGPVLEKYENGESLSFRDGAAMASSINALSDANQSSLTKLLGDVNDNRDKPEEAVKLPRRNPDANDIAMFADAIIAKNPSDIREVISILEVLKV